MGYNVHPVGAQSLTLDLPNNHVFLVVHIPSSDDGDESSDGDMYLVDVGFPWPINGPINLKLLPLEYEAGGFKIRYQFNEDENIYQRVLIGGDPINNEFDDKNEARIDMNFELKPQDFKDFGDTMNIIFSDSEVSFFLNTTLLFRYITLEDENNFEYVCCLGRKIILGTATTRQIHSYETYNEMIPDVLKYFPKLDADELAEACDVYQSKH
ncbi:unnamed protein product [Allacma fusca]|uniref:Uncharacterized protein n=1 Tax=Allacma fusca TaxID=39272 RepID=A0A8J2PLL5_9HEXA|nr:unnamed protein product [Allacma fusca]